MRKILCFLLLFTTMAFMLLITGCSKNDEKPVAKETTASTTVSETTSTKATGKITKDIAEDIALKDAGFSFENATVNSIEKDTENGKEVYKIEFEAEGYDYDYVIDVATGVVLQATREHKTTSETIKETTSEKNITLGDAKKIAINHAGTPEGAVTFSKAELGTDDGIKIYEINFIAGNTEYEYDIDATTGKIISFEKDSKKVSDTSSDSDAQTSLLIPSSQAVRIALVDAGVRESDAKIEPVDLDAENGVQYYDVTFIVSNIEYEYKINAETGEIIEADKD